MRERERVERERRRERSRSPPPHKMNAAPARAHARRSAAQPGGAARRRPGHVLSGHGRVTTGHAPEIQAVDARRDLPGTAMAWRRKGRAVHAAQRRLSDGKEAARRWCARAHQRVGVGFRVPVVAVHEGWRARAQKCWFGHKRREEENWLACIDGHSRGRHQG